MTFEQFLREKHAKEYEQAKLFDFDTFDRWIGILVSGREVMNYAEEWHRQEVGKTLQLLLKGQTDEKR